MKFDTKKGTPVKGFPSPFNSPNALEKKNPACPNVDLSGGNDSKTELGRQVMFETYIVSTPVVASKRIHEEQANSGRRRFLEQDDLDCLTGELNKLAIGNSAEKQKHTEKNDVTFKKEEEKAEKKVCSGDDSDEENKSELGRVEKKIFYSQTGERVTVKRSVRLALM